MCRAPRLLCRSLLLALGCAGGEAEPSEPASQRCPSDLPSRDSCGAAAPTYAEAAPILEQRCLLCHYPDNPLSGVVLDDYEQVFSRRQTVLSRIYSCVMPPEAASPLSAEERATLLSWLVCGAAGQ